ncbi:MAG: recombinase family protein [Clostridium sp.]|jgi:DNA invertase Pin-like site-specific DNA recombinase|nr:recombinase family protein [Clostridium sp.]
MPKNIGYVRVSSTDQNEDRQLISMRNAQVPAENIFLDKQSGKDFNRPQYQQMLNVFEPGDTLFIKSIDRLGRNYDEILKQWHLLTKENRINIVVLDMPLLDTRQDKNLMGTLIADIVLQLLSFVAQSERENIKQRQAEGIAAAKCRGVKFGRKIKKPPANFAKIVALWESKEMSFEEVLHSSGLKQTTFYRRLREYRNETNR